MPNQYPFDLPREILYALLISVGRTNLLVATAQLPDRTPMAGSFSKLTHLPHRESGSVGEYS
jgi:hypothetical protein